MSRLGRPQSDGRGGGLSCVGLSASAGGVGTALGSLAGADVNREAGRATQAHSPDFTPVGGEFWPHDSCGCCGIYVVTEQLMMLLKLLPGQRGATYSIRCGRVVLGKSLLSPVPAFPHL